jgi:hypothetical protein
MKRSKTKTKAAYYPFTLAASRTNIKNRTSRHSRIFVSRDFESGLYIDYFDNVPIDLVVRFIASHGGIKCDV